MLLLARLVDRVGSRGMSCERPDTLTAHLMKLIIQIPCLNEEATLPATIADLPRAARRHSTRSSCS